MTKRKGIIEVATEELARVQGLVDTNYGTVKDLHRKASQLRENNPNDFKAMKEAAELVEEARHYEAIAERLISNDVFIAQRSLDEKKEYLRKFKSHVDVLKEHLATTEQDLEQLKVKHQRDLEQAGRDIDNASWRLEQAKQELDELEGV